MGAITGIQWCHHTFNPWRGCTKISPGCQHCYAEKLSARNPAVLGEWGPGGKRVIASESYWRQPLAWDRAAARAGERRRVFCASLADVFEDRPELVLPRVRLYHLISETRNLDWLLLTKRPENVRLCHGSKVLPRSWPENFPRNVWLGVSVENQEYADQRIPLLLETSAAVRFLSVEPLLGPVDLTWWLHPPCGPRDPRGDHLCNLCHSWQPGIAWVIVGGESGRDARPCFVEHVRSLVRQCRDAGVACFVKQLGTRVCCELRATNDPNYRGVMETRYQDPKGGDMAEWPEDLRIREFPEVRL